MSAGKKLAECMNKDEILRLYGMLRVIADVNRLRILCLLFKGEKCVCDIEEQLEISQPLASHHLAVLREAGLVEVRREGTWCYYSLVKAAIEELNDMFVQILGVHRLPAGYPAREKCDKIP